MRVQKRPIIIDNVHQWFPNGPQLEGVYADASGTYVVTAHRQRSYITPGDYIFPEPDGKHFYPVKPDIFSQFYDVLI